MEFTRGMRLGALAVVVALCGAVGGVAVVASPLDAAPPGATSAPEPVGDAGATAASPAVTEDREVDRDVPDETPAPVAVDAAVQRQLAYVLAHWSDYNVDEYGSLGTTDCVNFASQSLIERGWEMDEEWWTEGIGDDFSFSSAWVSSTAFMYYLYESGRATPLTDDQRDQVKLGDIAQFDWDDSGDRDHTAIVTRIEGSGDDIRVFYGGHTDDTDYRSVDYAITEKHPGGTAYYWSVP
ncbi:MAG: hypothetical protein JWQ68_1122 [Cryobacterium sp.]|nr:hypothetical protein [Cryobacterium sp.]